MLKFSKYFKNYKTHFLHFFADTRLILVDLESNLIPELFTETFQPISESLLYLLLHNNRLSSLPTGIFANLSALNYLELDNNPITELSPNIFDSLKSLNFLSLQSTNLSSLPPQLLANTQKITEINLSRNEISDIPENFFGSMSDLEYLNIDYLNLSVLNSTSFGSALESLTFLRARSNRINSIDPQFINNATKLTQLYLLNNICTDMNFQNVQENIEEVRGELWRCFGNFEN